MWNDFGVPTFSQQERQALVEALLEAGPDAPTLCEGWTARDLAAHLVIRERRPDTVPGILVPGFARWTERLRLRYAARPFDELVELVRTGPPAFSPFAVPALEAQANIAEHFIHCEDVRRGRAGWTARALEPAFQDELWKRVRLQARFSLRRSPVGVVLDRTDAPDGAPHRVMTGPEGPQVTLRGLPSELMLYLFNRTGATLVDVDGSPSVVEQFRSVRLGL